MEPVNIDLTAKQTEAWKLLEEPTSNIFLYGGARSGKSYVIALWIIIKSMLYPRLRSLVARLTFSAAKSSIWHETFHEVLNILQQKGRWKENRSDWYIEFDNGSEIWLGGFDEKERTEKLLGHEYNVVYFNEISQIAYDTVELGLTRLAKKTKGFWNKALYDCNPPSPLHWAHKLFIEGVDPRDPKRTLAAREDYSSLLLNPKDNRENLTEDFFKRLANLSDRTRRRMELGEWVKAEGTIYERFDESMVVAHKDLPKMERYTAGLDFGLNMAAVLIGWCGDSVYVLEDHGGYDVTASEFNSQLKAKWGDKLQTIYCDPSGGERLQEITNSAEANNSVEPGIDAINAKIVQGRFFICEDATGVLSEIWDYRREIVSTRYGQQEKIVKQNDHYMDAMRYGIFSELAEPLQIFV